MFIGKTDAEAETPIVGQLMGRADSLEKRKKKKKTLMLGKIDGKRSTGWQEIVR